jgi:hypothetical protein
VETLNFNWFSTETVRPCCGKLRGGVFWPPNLFVMANNATGGGCAVWIVLAGILFLMGRACGGDKAPASANGPLPYSGSSYRQYDTAQNTGPHPVSKEANPSEQYRRADDATVPVRTKRRRIPRSEHYYIRGPRGGCYYINSNGNKVYVDRSLCN